MILWFVYDVSVSSTAAWYFSEIVNGGKEKESSKFRECKCKI